MKESLINKFGIPLADSDELYVSSAVEWLKENTKLNIDESEELPSNVKLFIVKYVETLQSDGNVASESIAGMSQSFKSDAMYASIWQYANTLLQPYLRSQVRFTSAKAKWESWG